MSNNNFGEYLAQLRIEAGYRFRKSLADASGVSNSTLTRIENGLTKYPEPATLAKLAPYLNVSLEQLMQAAGYLKEADENNENDVENIENSENIEIEKEQADNNPNINGIKINYQYYDRLPEEAKKSIEDFIDYIIKKYVGNK